MHPCRGSIDNFNYSTLQQQQKCDYPPRSIANKILLLLIPHCNKNESNPRLLAVYMFRNKTILKNVQTNIYFNLGRLKHFFFSFFFFAEKQCSAYNWFWWVSFCIHICKVAEKFVIIAWTWTVNIRNWDPSLLLVSYAHPVGFW